VVEGQRRLRASVALAGAAQQRAHAGDELARAERLGEVVVGAEVEAADAVVLGRLCGEHDDRDVGVAAHLAAHLLAGQVREHEVEDHDARPERLRQREQVAAADRGQHLVTVGL
jgi:hypothetical protein